MKQVVLALFCYQNHVLTAWRKPTQDQGTCWEFPGGKVEAAESAEEALHREVQEEIGVEITSFVLRLKYTHRYPDEQLTFMVYQIRADPLKLYAQEKQFLRWYPINRLRFEDFPLANRAIIRALRLPGLYAITPNCTDPEQAVASVQAIVRRYQTGVWSAQNFMLSLRFPELFEYTQVVQNVLPMTQAAGIPVLIHDHLDSLPEMADSIAGIHFSQKGFSQLQQRPVRSNQFVAVSCHNLKEVTQAQKRGADFCVLGPVQSHVKFPAQQGIGWEGFHQIVQQVDIPVLALGGIQLGDLPAVHRCGGQGIAGIRCFQNGQFV